MPWRSSRLQKHNNNNNNSNKSSSSNNESNSDSDTYFTDEETDHNTSVNHNFLIHSNRESNNKFLKKQQKYSKGKYHGWIDRFDRRFHGHYRSSNE